MNFLKKYKVFIAVIGAFLLVLYLLFLFAVPNLINLNNYKKDIQKIVSDTAKLDFDFQDMKIVTTPSLKAGVNIKGARLSYPEDGEIASLNEAEVKIALLPLILKTVQISDIYIDKPEAKLVLLKNSQIDVLDYINKNIPMQEENPDTAVQELPVKISAKLPVVTVKDYSFVLVDEKTNHTLALKGDSFIFDDAVLNKHFRVSANGKFLINNEENILYNAKVKMFWPVIAQTEQSTAQQTPQIDFVKEIVKYNPKADINADITLKEHSGHTDINGYLNADKISLKLDNKSVFFKFIENVNIECYYNCKITNFFFKLSIFKLANIHPFFAFRYHKQFITCKLNSRIRCSTSRENSVKSAYRSITINFYIITFYCKRTNPTHRMPY